ncbi:tRNA CCA-pyrophosphorylase [Archaeoglobales archaeon]|nr:MAG: tRNA CCA-pyrophosphorylase [Archaeoglobales archaeon]
MPITPMEIYKWLPKTNCKKCGEATCMSFAFKLLNREKKLEDCTPLFEEKKYEKQREKLIELLKPLEEATETGLIVDEDLCVGCGNCVVVCPVHVELDPKGAAIGKGPTIDDPILRVENGKVKVINMEACRRYGKNRVLCVVCRENCPTDAIRFLEG